MVQNLQYPKVHGANIFFSIRMKLSLISRSITMALGEATKSELNFFNNIFKKQTNFVRWIRRFHSVTL